MPFLDPFLFQRKFDSKVSHLSLVFGSGRPVGSCLVKRYLKILIILLLVPDDDGQGHSSWQETVTFLHSARQEFQ